MITAQNLGTAFMAELEAYLLNPVHSRMFNPQAFRLNPALAEGERLMLPVCEDEHVTSHTFLDQNEKPHWTARDHAVGYWQTLMSETLYYRDLASPVWRMSISGGFAEECVGRQEEADSVFRFLARCAKPVFARRRAGNRIFYPRGIERFEDGDRIYLSTWEGGFESFTGSENVFRGREKLWSADFHGRILLSKGLRPTVA